MKRMIMSLCLVVLLAFPLAVNASDPPGVLEPGFKVEELAGVFGTPLSIVSPLHRAGAGQFGPFLYVGTQIEIIRVDKANGDVSPFQVSPEVSFVAGLSFFGGPFGEYLYVGNRGRGITRFGPEIFMPFSPFALQGESIGGLDFGRGKYGNDLYAIGPKTGDIWRVDPDGNAVKFAYIPPPSPFPAVEFDTRVSIPIFIPAYLKFSPGIPSLFVTNTSNKIYQVSPDGTRTVFATIADAEGLLGFDFGPGGAFGRDLYVGRVTTDGPLNGQIYKVDAEGNAALWAEFPAAGVSDIHFDPGQEGGFVMYVAGFNEDDFGAVWAISKQ